MLPVRDGAGFSEEVKVCDKRIFLVPGVSDLGLREDMVVARVIEVSGLRSFAVMDAAFEV